MLRFLAFLLGTFIILSCTTTGKKNYTVIMIYKEHKFLNDNAKPAENRDTFQAENNEDAYLYGVNRFSHYAGLWNDTAFWAPIEPLSFKVIDNNNIDVRTIIDKNTIQRLDSLMWVDIKQKRERMSKTKVDFLKSVDTIHGGLTNLIDSLVEKSNSKPRNKK